MDSESLRGATLSYLTLLNRVFFRIIQIVKWERGLVGGGQQLFQIFILLEMATCGFRFGSSDLCLRCNTEPETISHCLRECPKTKAIWYSLNLKVYGQQLDCWLRSGMNSNAFLFSATIWWIWRDRNNDVFNPANP
ncbi:hypothetical protein AHAS_Ahas20G0157400 [Arachis hypogaea]